MMDIAMVLLIVAGFTLTLLLVEWTDKQTNK